MNHFAKNTMLCWTPGTNQIKLVSWPDPEGHSKKYSMFVLACFSNFRKKSFKERSEIVYHEAMVLIIRDKCPPAFVHKTLMGLKEYVYGLPDDMLSTKERCIRDQEEADWLRS